MNSHGLTMEKRARVRGHHQNVHQLNKKTGNNKKICESITKCLWHGEKMWQWSWSKNDGSLPSGRFIFDCAILAKSHLSVVTRTTAARWLQPNHVPALIFHSQSKWHAFKLNLYTSHYPFAHTKKVAQKMAIFMDARPQKIKTQFYTFCA